MKDVFQLNHVDKISAAELLQVSRATLPFLHDLSFHRNGNIPENITDFYKDLSRCHYESFGRSSFIESYFNKTDIPFFEYDDMTKLLEDSSNEAKLFDILYGYFLFYSQVELLCKNNQINTDIPNPYAHTITEISQKLSKIPADEKPIYSLSHTFDHLLLLNERLPIAQQKANGYITDYIQLAIESSPQPLTGNVDHRKITNFKQHITSVPKILKDIFFVVSKDKFLINAVVSAKTLQQRGVDFLPVNLQFLYQYRNFQMSQYKKSKK